MQKGFFMTTGFDLYIPAFWHLGAEPQVVHAWEKKLIAWVFTFSLRGDNASRGRLHFLSQARRLRVDVAS